MNLNYFQRAVGVFATHQQAEHALGELQNAGFAMDRVSVIARGAQRTEMAGATINAALHTQTDEGAKTGVAAGSALGGLTGLLVGLGAVAIPGVGPVLLGGAAATVLATTLAGSAIGAAAGGLIGALIGIGIPEDRARVYSDRVSQGNYLVMLEGSETELQRAEEILHQRGIEEWGVYQLPQAPIALPGQVPVR